ncbi:hypothetical protein C816_02059 [Oscillibacter sp. 1-3]|nr:hypothetical protein C816_02059 [Oscillibacter sp. 1-3]
MLYYFAVYYFVNINTSKYQFFMCRLYSHPFPFMCTFHKNFRYYIIAIRKLP